MDLIHECLVKKPVKEKQDTLHLVPARMHQKNRFNTLMGTPWVVRPAKISQLDKDSAQGPRDF